MKALSNREKSHISGELYNPDSEGLPEDRLKAAKLCHQISSCFDSVEKNDLIQSLFGRSDQTTQLNGNFFCDYGYNIEVGKNFYMNTNGVILDCGKVIIGDYVMIGPNVTLCTAGHPIDAATRYTYEEFAKPICIADKVWIGANVVVLPGVSIGFGAVVGAGSVVTQDVPKNTVVVGNPARVVKENINTEQAGRRT
ncbi:sugar O-acetyltransferase [Vibrio alginolyticus]|uniref:sugar O-acetyltransferase n=1 Tax=Vibrio alginolyticus TaxID=663 RepID=UPI00215D111E|nr:sugar O-acetyltransferase [Vibrio alginolyticus]EGQ8488587.1 sugar O-acetyltransferase [Vibrio alginolyticus]EKP4442229.1 sugar O-acetyltransferase [Vibrio alginolyticus]ELB2798689.1 sugar O-acetyltransferase [Vibrio alginolyticus]ELB2808064.1 sugar O-acetyltransferase [Vibrio alginolyticus]ELB2846138.1 sugar O-acetyltransferase [Vibrio alginolyticus]